MSAATEEAAVEQCDLGVGCDEAGVCYADAHGQPEKCGRIYSRNALAHELDVRMRAFAASEKGSANEARQAIALADTVGRNEKAILAALRPSTPAEDAERVATFCEALACDCDEGESNDWEDYEWRDAAALLREAATNLRALSRPTAVGEGDTIETLTAEIAALREENAQLRQGIAGLANDFNVAGSNYDKAITAIDEMVREVKQAARALLSPERQLGEGE